LPSRAHGVGNVRTPYVRGGGQQEQPIAAVSGADVGCAQAQPARVVPDLGQITVDDVEPSAQEGGDVLHEDELGSKYANGVGDAAPQARVGAGDPGLPARVADVLAGEAGGEDVDRCDVGPGNAAEVDDAGIGGSVWLLRQTPVTVNLPCAPPRSQHSVYIGDLHMASARPASSPVGGRAARRRQTTAPSRGGTLMDSCTVTIAEINGTWQGPRGEVVEDVRQRLHDVPRDRRSVPVLKPLHP
jgi:hypothetical protein